MHLAGNGVRMAAVRWGVHRRWVVGLGVMLPLVLSMALAACGNTSTPALPTVNGGVFTSTAYHFKVTYPKGWQANAAQQQQNSKVVPLTVVITQSGAAQAPGAATSTLIITVFNARDPNIAASIAGLAKDQTLTAVKISGLPAYTDKPIHQTLPNTSLTATHTDYYLVTGEYEYQLSTDAISGSGAESALQNMIASFTILP